MQSTTDLLAKRRNAVSSLVAVGKKPAEIATELKSRGIVNPKSGKPFSRQTIKSDMRAIAEMQNMRPLAETIGQWTYTKPLWGARILLNVDTVYKDLVFWDALRRGMAPGYEIGGLFCMPIAQTITSHALGAGISASLMESASPKSTKDKEATKVHEDGKPTANLKTAAKTNGNGNAAPNGKPGMNAGPGGPMLSLVAPKPKPEPVDPVTYTNAQLKRMMERMQAFMQTVITDMYCLGNQYVVVNPDTTFAIISPETVTVEYAAADYRLPVRYIIRTKMEKARVEDTYTAEKRTLRIKYNDDRPSFYEEYENLIGRIPIVHFANDRSANEVFGRPLYEAALPVMRSYDDLIYKTIEGVNLLGNPIPVFEGLDNPSETKMLNSDATTYTDEDGNQQTEYVTRFDRNTGIYLGKGGSAKMLTPPVGFTKDSLDTLRQLFLLLLNHTRVPEFVWGGAIASSKASTESQMPPFIQYIKYRRLQLEGEGADPALGIEARGGLLELIDIWLRTYKLLNPTIVVGPVKVDWPGIDIHSEEVKAQWGMYLGAAGKLAPEDELKMAGYWDDPSAVAARAAGEKRRPPKFDEYDAKLNQARLDLARASLVPPHPDENPYSTDYVTPANSDAEEPYQITGPLVWQGMLGGQV